MRDKMTLTLIQIPSIQILSPQVFGFTNLPPKNHIFPADLRIRSFLLSPVSSQLPQSSNFGIRDILPCPQPRCELLQDGDARGDLVRFGECTAALEEEVD